MFTAPPTALPSMSGVRDLRTSVVLTAVEGMASMFRRRLLRSDEPSIAPSSMPLV